jgi:dolichyl-phosphate-mannose--protein O-mannosyl transferase
VRKASDLTPFLGLAAIIAIAIAVYAVRLDQPKWDGPVPRYTYDEKYTAFTANRIARGDSVAYKSAARRYEYLRGDTDDLSLLSRSEWTSPPGAPLALVPFIAAFGYSEVSSRMASIIAAAIALLATASLAGRRSAGVACALVAFDGVFFVLARTAMPYIFLVAGVTAGAALTVRALRADQHKNRHRWILLAGAGLAFGFGISVRLTGVPLCLAVLVAVAISREGTEQRFLAPCLFVALVAATTYLASYIPFLASGHSLKDVVDFHRSMAWFHAHVPSDFPQGSRWYTWPWAMTPVVFRSDQVGSDTAVVWVVGGKLLWWALVPALIYGLWRGRNRAMVYLLPAATIAAAWLPWAALDRFALFYYLVPALPFTAVLVARALHEGRKRLMAPAYIGLSLLLFVATYPVLAAVPLEPTTLARYATLLGVAR